VTVSLTNPRINGPFDYRHTTDKSFRSEILKLFPIGGRFSPRKILGPPFRYLRSTFGVNNSRTLRRWKTLTNERHILGISSVQ